MSRELQLAVESIRRLERASAADLGAYLATRLDALVRHAAETTPHYRRALAEAGWRAGQPLTERLWRRIPLLDRELPRERPEEVLAERVPESCGATRWIQSSGSSGAVTRVLGTAQQAALWNAATICEHLEHRRDFAGRLAAIRVVNGPYGRPPDGSDFPDWGAPVNALHRTGPSALLSIEADSRTQARWLARRDPHYLLIFPSMLGALIDALDEEGLALPSLRQVRSVSEALGEDSRERCRRQLGVEVADVYSAVEVGYVATQTPELEGYRCRNETVLVEVLDEDGRPAPPGEPGRVAVTALFSYAMPLIRYALGDVAIAGDRSLWCEAPRYLAHVVGRRRNLMRLPDGSRRWPRLGLRRMTEIAALRRVQLVQTAIDTLVLKVVCADPLTPAQHEMLERHLVRRFDSIRSVTVEQIPEIPRGAGGKFEEFRCEI